MFFVIPSIFQYAKNPDFIGFLTSRVKSTNEGKVINDCFGLFSYQNRKLICASASHSGTTPA